MLISPLSGALESSALAKRRSDNQTAQIQSSPLNGTNSPLVSMDAHCQSQESPPHKLLRASLLPQGPDFPQIFYPVALGWGWGWGSIPSSGPGMGVRVLALHTGPVAAPGTHETTQVRTSTLTRSPGDPYDHQSLKCSSRTSGLWRGSGHGSGSSVNKSFPSQY